MVYSFIFHACDLNFALSQLLHKQCMRCSSHYAPLAEKVHVRQPHSKAFGCQRCRPGPSILASPYWSNLHTTDMLSSWTLLVSEVSLGMKNELDLMSFGFLLHANCAISRMTAPGGNCMPNIPGGPSIAKFAHAILGLHDGYVSARSLGTPAPCIGQMGSHAAPTGSPQI